MPGSHDPKLSVRFAPEGYRRLQKLSAQRNVSLSRCVRQIVDEVAADTRRRSRRALSEEELLDLLRERAETATSPRSAHCSRWSATAIRAGPRSPRCSGWPRRGASERANRARLQALGSAPTWRELELVADTLRASGDEDAIAGAHRSGPRSPGESRGGVGLKRCCGARSRDRVWQSGCPCRAARQPTINVS